MRLKCHHMVDDAQKAGAEGPFPIVGAKPKKGQLWIDETPVAVAPAAQKDDDAVSSASNISAEPTPEPEAAQAPVASSAPEVEMAPVATPVPVAVTAPVAMSVRQAAKAPVATPTPFSTTAPVALPVSQAVTAPVATPAPSASTAAPPSRATEADALEGLMMLSQAGAMHRDEGENRMATRQSSHYRCTIDYLVHH